MGDEIKNKIKSPPSSKKKVNSKHISSKQLRTPNSEFQHLNIFFADDEINFTESLCSSLHTIFTYMSSPRR